MNKLKTINYIYTDEIYLFCCLNYEQIEKRQDKFHLISRMINSAKLFNRIYLGHEAAYLILRVEYFPFENLYCLSKILNSGVILNLLFQRKYSVLKNQYTSLFLDLFYP